MSKFLSQLLKHAYVKDEKHVKDSFQFVESIKSVRIPEGYVLVSLDVVSLFTNIPIDLATSLIIKNWPNIADHTKLSQQSFVQLFNFCIDNSFFEFDGYYYKQIFGLGMGNCLAPVVSDIVMTELQKTALQLLPFQVPFFKRFVDDICTSIPADFIQLTLDTFNSFHPRLQFTIELEVDYKLPFLDTILIRNDNGMLSTDWFHKPTFSERFLNYYSHHPFSHKLNLIKNLKHRALSLSDTMYHSKNLSNIKKYLIKNNFPISLLNKILYNGNYSSIPSNETHDESIKYFKIPYVGNLSERVRLVLQSETLKVALKPSNNNKQLFSNLKGVTSKELLSNIVYKIPCHDCAGVYIGQTGRYLKTRITEHKRDMNNVHNPIKRKENGTALAEHAFSTLHMFDFDGVEVIGKQTNLKKRLLDEMICIKTNQNSINKRTDIDNLNKAYYYLISRIKEPD